MRQEGLVYAKNDAESARRAQQIFLSRTSHELRTPIHILNGFSELLSLTDLDKSQKELIDRVCSAGNHLSELVADVLDLSQIDQGRLAIRLETVEIDRLVADVVEQMGPEAEARSALLVWSPLRTEEIVAIADPARLRQVLMNLLTNALKYAGGTIMVSTDTSDSEIAIHVVDEGPGVAASDLDGMFAPFERLGAALGEEPGAGLGLSVARSLCEAMGGALCAESEVGVGSRFTVTLPVELSAADDEPNTFLPAEWMGIHT
jgi:signal transduction histidine kinase